MLWDAASRLFVGTTSFGVVAIGYFGARSAEAGAAERRCRHSTSLKPAADPRRRRCPPASCRRHAAGCLDAEEAAISSATNTSSGSGILGEVSDSIGCRQVGSDGDGRADADAGVPAGRQARRASERRGPTRLQARRIQAGKLPLKVGLTLVRHENAELTLHAESLAVMASCGSGGGEEHARARRRVTNCELVETLDLSDSSAGCA